MGVKTGPPPPRELEEPLRFASRNTSRSRSLGLTTHVGSESDLAVGWRIAKPNWTPRTNKPRTIRGLAWRV